MRHIFYFFIFIPNIFSQPNQIIGQGLTGQDLLEYVVSNYKTFTTLGYNTARDIMYGTIDLKEGNQLSGVYTGYTITLDTSQDPSTNAYEQGINCEHTWPQSMGAGNEPQKSDLHYLFPCKSNVNSSRGNDPYADIPDEDTDIWYRNNYSQGSIPEEFIDEYAEKYNPPDPTDERFEPRDDHKGNAARAMFYFFTMYQDIADVDFWNIQKELLYQWHQYDAVDDWEYERTWAIADYQEGMPNPFVIDSTLARRIWFYTPADPSGIVITEIMPNPSAVLDYYGEWFEIHNTTDSTVDIHGWIIADGGNDNHTITNNENSVLVTSGDYFVFTCNADVNLNGGLESDYEYSSFFLSNSEDEIILLDNTGAIVDEIHYNNSWAFGSGKSREIHDVNADNNTSENWFESTIAYSSGDCGTPGESFQGLVNIDNTIPVPEHFKFHAPYPNPFNPIITINIQIEMLYTLSLRIYDMNGRVVESLLDNDALASGNYKFQWNAQAHSSGIYFVKLNVAGKIITQKVVLIK